MDRNVSVILEDDNISVRYRVIMMHKEIYEVLGINEKDSLQYMEDLSELLEYEKYLNVESVKEILKDVDCETMSDYFRMYFKKMEEWIPDDEVDFYILVDNISRSFAGKLERLKEGQDGDSETESVIRADLAEEICRFRAWYAIDKTVKKKSDKDGELECVSVMEALATYGAEKFGEEKHYYDFNDALAYDIDSYVANLADMVDNEDQNSGFGDM